MRAGSTTTLSYGPGGSVTVVSGNTFTSFRLNGYDAVSVGKGGNVGFVNWVTVPLMIAPTLMTSPPVTIEPLVDPVKETPGTLKIVPVKAPSESCVIPKGTVPLLSIVA